MKTKKKAVIVTSIIISLIIISSVTISNPLLVDRAFYRMGFQEQICFPIIDEEFQSNNVTNVAVAGDFGINEIRIDVITTFFLVFIHSHKINFINLNMVFHS